MKKIIGCIAVLLVLCMATSSVAFAGEAQTTVQIMGPWVVESPEDSVLKSVVEGFEAAYPQYKVELIGVPSADVNKQVQAMAASQTLPDLVINNGANNAAWKEMGIVENIESKFSKEFLDGFYPEMLKAFYYEDELFGLPTCAAPFVLLLRNDLLTEAGIEVPKSYDEILAAAKKLTVDTNGDGKIDRYGLGLMGFPDGWTQIPWKGKKAEDCPDAPRYKACGNSMCVNVMRWIGLRIDEEERRIQDGRGEGQGS